MYTSEDVATNRPAPIRVRLAPAVVPRLRHVAKLASPLECCGLLIGRMTENSIDVRTIVQAPNAASDAARRFALPAGPVLAAQREAETEGLDVVGFYHSHPHGPAQPSKRDIEGAPAGYLHVIVSMHGVRAWHRADPDLPLNEVAL